LAREISCSRLERLGTGVRLVVAGRVGSRSRCSSVISETVSWYSVCSFLAAGAAATRIFSFSAGAWRVVLGAPGWPWPRRPCRPTGRGGLGVGGLPIVLPWRVVRGIGVAVRWWWCPPRRLARRGAGIRLVGRSEGTGAGPLPAPRFRNLSDRPTGCRPARPESVRRPSNGTGRPARQPCWTPRPPWTPSPVRCRAAGRLRGSHLDRAAALTGTDLRQPPQRRSLVAVLVGQPLRTRLWQTLTWRARLRRAPPRPARTRVQSH